MAKSRLVLEAADAMIFDPDARHALQSLESHMGELKDELTSRGYEILQGDIYAAGSAPCGMIEAFHGVIVVKVRLNVARSIQ